MLSIGPNVAPAQELIAEALDFDNEENRLSTEETEVVNVHPPQWLLHESLILTTASYEGNFIDFAVHNGSRITRFAQSGLGYTSGKFYIVEFSHEGHDWIVFVFRGYEGSDSVRSFLPRIAEADGVVSDDLSPKHSIHPSYISEAIRQGKRVLITGHSLGGIQAHLLTARVLRELKANGEEVRENFYCITYGAPVVSDDVTTRSIAVFRHVFYHYILENDIVPKSYYFASCVPNAGTGTGLKESIPAVTLPHSSGVHPFGRVFVATRHEQTKTVTVRLLPRGDYSVYYSLSWKLIDTRDHAVHHAMKQYFLVLNELAILRDLTTTKDADDVTVEEKTIIPFIRNCYLTGFELEIEGESLAVVDQLFINNLPVKFNVYSSTSIIGRLERDETMLFTSNVVDISLTTIFRQREEDKIEFKRLPLRLLGNSKVDMFPNELIASIIPFTTLMLQDESLKNASEHQESIAELLQTVDYELKKIESCIPVEFAFNMLTRDVHKNHSGSNTTTIETHKHMKKFLKRLREVEVMDWSKLCSTYMLRVLRDSIEYLTEVIEKGNNNGDIIDRDMENALQSSFNPSSPTLTNGWFEKLYVSTFDGFCESIYCANQSLSNRHFWDFVYKKQIKVGITFTLSSQKAFEYIPFNEPYRLKTAEGIVIIEKENTEASNENNVVVFTNRYKLTFPNPNIHNNEGEGEVLTFLHFEIFKGPNTPETKQWIGKITKTIGRVIVASKAEIRKTSFNSILVQSFDDFTLSTWFTYAWFLQYERDWPDNNRIDEINKILSEQIPIGQIDQFSKNDFKHVHDEIIYGIQSTYGFNIGLYFTKHPKRKVLVDLKIVREEMLSNHYSVSPPFFSGLAVDFEVKDSTKGFKTVPFFNFLPKAIKFDENVKWEQVLDASIQVTDGLEFMLVMLDRYVLLTREELYQIRNNDIKTKAKNIALAAVQVVPTAVWGGYQMAKYLSTRKLHHVVNVEQRFRRMYDKIVFSDQQVASYKELLTNLVGLLNLEIASDASIETIEDVLYYSIPSAIGKYSLSELMVHADEILTDDVPVYARWKELLNPRSKAVHLFIMKQIYHCHRLRMIRSKFITIGVNGQKNSGKSTLVQKVCGENYLPHIITGENPRESTIFPTGYHYPYDLPNYPPAMIIDLPGCTDADTENIVSLFCDCVDVSIFMIYAREAANFNNSALKNFLIKFIHNRHGPSLICINGIDNNLKKYPKLKENEHFEESSAKQFLLEVLEENRVNWSNSKALNLTKPANGVIAPMWNVEGRTVLNEAAAKGEKADYPLLQSVVHSSGRDGGDYPLSVWLTSLEGLDQYPPEFSNHIFGVEHIRQWIQEVREYYQGYRKKETFQNLKETNSL